ncbi:MAG: riboflavin synthase, partial [Phycisphaerae bacterium]
MKSVLQNAGGLLLTIDLGKLAEDSKIGDSIAINGVCLTIAELSGNFATFELSTETLTKSALGGLKSSSSVNVERAMKATDRFGGHFVQGHIDGTATVETIKRLGQFAYIRFVA